MQHCLCLHGFQEQLYRTSNVFVVGSFIDKLFIAASCGWYHIVNYPRFSLAPTGTLGCGWPEKAPHMGEPNIVCMTYSSSATVLNSMFHNATCKTTNNVIPWRYHWSETKIFVTVVAAERMRQKPRNKGSWYQALSCLNIYRVKPCAGLSGREPRCRALLPL